MTNVFLKIAATAIALLVTGENLLRAQTPAEIWAIDSDGQNARRVAHAPDFPIINSPEVSPDGRFVAVDGWKVTEDLMAAQLLIIDL